MSVHRSFVVLMGVRIKSFKDFANALFPHVDLDVDLLEEYYDGLSCFTNLDSGDLVIGVELAQFDNYNYPDNQFITMEELQQLKRETDSLLLKNGFEPDARLILYDNSC